MTPERVNMGELPEHRALIAYWHHCADSAGRVSRRAFDPGHVRAQLARLSLIECLPGRAPRVRLIGSELIGAIGQDLRGEALGNVPAAWQGILGAGLDEARAARCPVAGLSDGAPGGRLHVWLRLPLWDEAGGNRLVLCHDCFVPAPSLIGQERRFLNTAVAA